MKKIILVFVLILIAFSTFLFFGKTNSPTGNAVLDNAEQNQEEPQELPVKEEVVVKETSIFQERKNYVKNSVTLNPYYVVYQEVRDNSEERFTNVHYKISSDHTVELLMFPTELDMVSYSEKKNLNYNRYPCGGIGKNIEGDCTVDNLGFAIWNSDGGVSARVNYELRFSSVEISPEKATIAPRILNNY